MTLSHRYSLVIPVYRNSESLDELVRRCSILSAKLRQPFEAVFVVDGSPDDSYTKLEQLLSQAPFDSQLVLLSKNFGSFRAIQHGLSIARGDFFAITTADLQDPIELAETFFSELETGRYDVVIGSRESREDPFFTRLFSTIFWFVFRKLAHSETPSGGVDLFGGNRKVCELLASLREANTSLVGLVLWIGFRRQVVNYRRSERIHGKSAWSFKKRFRYLSDSLYSFSDLPIRLLISIGILSILSAIGFALVVLAAKATGSIAIPGYAATVLTITFFGGLNSLGLGLIGGYTWRAYENTKSRPNAIAMIHKKYSQGKELPSK